MGGAPHPFINGKALGTRLDIAWVHIEEGTTLRARFFFWGAGVQDLIQYDLLLRKIALCTPALPHPPG